MPSRPLGLSDEALDRRSFARSKGLLLRMSPQLREQIDAAAKAAGMNRQRYLLTVIERALPPRLDLEEPRDEESRMAS